jgi:hypothetical protein
MKAKARGRLESEMVQEEGAALAQPAASAITLAGATAPELKALLQESCKHGRLGDLLQVWRALQ